MESVDSGDIAPLNDAKEIRRFMTLRAPMEPGSHIKVLKSQIPSDQIQMHKNQEYLENLRVCFIMIAFGFCVFRLLNGFSYRYVKRRRRRLVETVSCDDEKKSSLKSKTWKGFKSSRLMRSFWLGL